MGPPSTQKAVPPEVQRAIEAAIKPVNAKLARMEKELREVAADRDHLLGLLKETGRAVHRTEVAQRSHNMIVHGVEESTGIGPEAAMARVASQVGLTERGWTAVKRVGRVRQGPAAKPRPLQLRMESEAAKHRVFSSSSRFRQRGVHLDDDLTPAQQASRREQLATFRSRSWATSPTGAWTACCSTGAAGFASTRASLCPRLRCLPPSSPLSSRGSLQRPGPVLQQRRLPAQGSGRPQLGRRGQPQRWHRWQRQKQQRLRLLWLLASLPQLRPPAAPPAGTTATGTSLPGPPQPLLAQQAAQPAPAEPPQVASA